VAGLTAEVCVSSTIREATDLGYECLLLEDGVAATCPEHLPSTVSAMRCEGGIFGSTAPTAAALEALLVAAAATAAAAHGHHATGEGAQAVACAEAKVEVEAEAEAEVEVEVAGAAPGPFRWPKGKVALLMIDWQGDFCEEGGFGHALGNDCSDASDVRRALKPAAAVLAAARGAGIPVIHTLEAHDPALADCPPTKKRRAPVIGEPVPGAAHRGRMLVRVGPTTIAEISCNDREERQRV
jgi:nicotinamidase-related amidase